MNLDLAANNILVKDGYAFFFGSPFSNWHKSPFEIDGIIYSTSEQYMMHQKALMFHDHETAQKILSTSDPKKQKALGRLVKNYNDALWSEHRFDVVYEGCFEKFYQNDDLGKLLLSTDKLKIVEASPFDKIWGCGLRMNDTNIVNESKWTGQNLLGKALMQVREQLRTIERIDMKFDNDITSNDYEKIIKILNPITHSRTGSSYIEEPPKLTTDIDYLILVHELKPAAKIIRENGWSDCTSNDDECNQERKMNNNWLAFRKNEFNIIVMDDIVFYINFMAATELLKKYNVKDKNLRIDVMRSIKFNQFENSLYVFINEYLNKKLT